MQLNELKDDVDRRIGIAVDRLQNGEVLHTNEFLQALTSFITYFPIVPQKNWIL